MSYAIAVLRALSHKHPTGRFELGLSIFLSQAVEAFNAIPTLHLRFDTLRQSADRSDPLIQQYWSRRLR
jgi:hypothetical protein